VLAIVVGLVAAFVVKIAMRPQPVVVAEQPEAPRVPTTTVVVLAKNLTEHQVVQRSDLRTVTIPRERQREGTLRLAEQAIGRISRQSLKAGQLLYEESLYGIGETLPGLASRIPPGMRAMPIHVDEQSVIAKMVKIGSRVDIALSVEGSHPDLGELATKTLMHNVEVIAVDTNNSSRRGGATSNATITVAVSPADANRLITAEGSGTLNMTLCGEVESETVPVSVGGEANKITRRELLGLSPIPPAPKPFVIERWQGGTVNLMKISPERVEEAIRSTAASKKFNPNQQVPVSTEGAGANRPAAGASTLNVTPTDVTEISVGFEQ
jgi:pilus assembly protein CpaB